MKEMGSTYVKVQSLTNQALIADKCFVANRFFDRLRGLIGKRKLEPGEAMFFPKCNDIHMWFMSMPIDVVFLRAEKSPRADGTRVFTISSVRENARPWKVLPLRDGNASETLELEAGAVRRHGLRAGDELCLS